MALRLTPTGDSGEVAQALAKAQAAQDAAEAAMERANNARGMVLADRERNALSLDELRAAAAQLPTTQQAAAEAHLALQGQSDIIREMVVALQQQLADIELTPGPQGERGPEGPQGEVGPRGTAGAAGATGLQGLRGETGQQGPKGDTGAAGTSADNARVTALETAVATLSAKAIIKQEKRVVTTQLLAIGGTTDMTIAWDTPFPNADYVVIPLLDASSGLSNVNPPALKSKTAAGCVVTVRANIAVAAGLAVNVVGLKFG